MILQSSLGERASFFGAAVDKIPGEGSFENFSLVS
jgi:hypothetical protein